MENTLIKDITTISLLLGLVFLYCVLIKKYIFDSNHYDSDLEKYVYIMNKKIRIRVINRIIIFLFGIPLMVYPLVLYALFMVFLLSLIIGIDIVTILFISAIVSYPFTIGLCWAQNTKKHNTHILLSAIPLVHICIIGLMYPYWVNTFNSAHLENFF